MADESLVSLLKQGAEAWNILRSERSRGVVDLRLANLRPADLREADGFLGTGQI